MITDRATCIVFSDDDFPLEGSGHICSLYISVACSGHRVPIVLLDNGSALNVCPLAIAIALGFSPFDFGSSTQTDTVYDRIQRTVMGTITAHVMIGPVRYSVLFQVLRIQSSFNLLLGRPWIHEAGITTQKVLFYTFNSLCFKHFCVVVLHLYSNCHVKDLAMTSNHICG